MNQGSEFISRDLDLRAYQRGVVLDFSPPGKPTDNAVIECFNGNCCHVRRNSEGPARGGPKTEIASNQTRNLAHAG